MSGIAGIVNLDGAPADGRLVARMTDLLAPHGRDGHEVWVDGPVALGHALLRSTPESEHERQPLTLDGRCWITADCRIDAREELRRTLATHDRLVEAGAPDATLILHAYAAWGEPCVDHLLGDFSFAIWDGPRRTLFCARDHFGVKPFYYALAGERFVFGSHLSGVRMHPAVAADLDETAIADFLVFGYGVDADRSSFSAIKRLPPAHTLRLAAGGCSVRRYWELPREDEFRFRHRDEYLEQFGALLDLATRDRLRGAKVSVLMSGGLDSTSVAATAQRILAASGQPFELHAHTIVFDRIIPDEERAYSTIAANALGIPIHHHAFDDFGFPPPEPPPPGHPPEPQLLLDWSRTIATHRPAAETAPVILRGDGADPLLLATANAPQQFLDDGRIWALTREYLWLVAARRQVPYFGIRTLLRRQFGRGEAPPEQLFPPWLRPALVERLHLHERWRAEAAFDPARPGEELASAYWPWFFEMHNGVMLRLPADIRYPFVDVRLVRWLLRVPQVPWLMEKSLLRLAMRGSLPASIVRRRKAPLAGNPIARLVPPASEGWWEGLAPDAPELAPFVDMKAATATLARALPEAQRTNRASQLDLVRSALRPLSLAVWFDRTGRDKLEP